MSMFLNLNHSGVPDTDCIESIEFFKPSSPFDFTCENKIDPFNGEDSKAKMSKVVAYYNEASAGKCTYVKERDLGGRYSVEV